MSSAGSPRRSGVGAPLPNPTGQSPRAAVSVSSARAEASRKNGARSRGPRTPEGKARAAQNALKHGMRAQKHLVLPDRDAAEFAGLEAALLEELAPVGALQAVLARRIALAAWRLARADRIEAELFEERRSADGGLGLAMVQDGNGTKWFETLLRYRGAAMAEFWRALRTLKALQAEQALETGPALAAHPLQTHPMTPAARRPLVRRPQPDEPERAAAPRLEYVPSAPSLPARTLHEAAALWLQEEPETGRARHAAPTPASRTNPAPHPNSTRPLADRPGIGQANPQPVNAVLKNKLGA
jgi:hypothetical protein